MARIWSASLSSSPHSASPAPSCRSWLRCVAASGDLIAGRVDAFLRLLEVSCSASICCCRCQGSRDTLRVVGTVRRQNVSSASWSSTFSLSALSTFCCPYPDDCTALRRSASVSLSPGGTNRRLSSDGPFSSPAARCLAPVSLFGHSSLGATRLVEMGAGRLLVSARIGSTGRGAGGDGGLQYILGGEEEGDAVAVLLRPASGLPNCPFSFCSASCSSFSLSLSSSSLACSSVSTSAVIFSSTVWGGALLPLRSSHKRYCTILGLLRISFFLW